MAGNKKGTVVIVEDDGGVRQAMARMLRLAGFVPLLFTSAEALIEEGVPSDAACLVFDVHLPGLSGFELRDRLMRAGMTTPVIFITAYDDTRTRTRAKSLGAAAFLPKPFSGHDLLSAVACAIASEPDLKAQNA